MASRVAAYFKRLYDHPGTKAFALLEVLWSFLTGPHIWSLLTALFAALMGYLSKSVEFISQYGVFGYLTAALLSFILLSFGGVLFRAARFGFGYASRGGISTQGREPMGGGVDPENTSDGQYRRSPSKYLRSFNATITIKQSAASLAAPVVGLSAFHWKGSFFVFVLDRPLFYGDSKPSATFSGAPGASAKFRPFVKDRGSEFSVALEVTGLTDDCSITVVVGNSH